MVETGDRIFGGATNEMKKIMMLILNSPAFLFLIVVHIFKTTVKAYVLDVWKDEAATKYPFWKWKNWSSVFRWQ